MVVATYAFSRTVEEDAWPATLFSEAAGSTKT